MKNILVIGGGAMGSAFTIPCLENNNKVGTISIFIKLKALLIKKNYYNIELFKITRIYILYEFNWTVLNFNAFASR